MNLIAQGSLFNQTGYAVPATKSIAVQFRIKDFPNGASDLIQALCDSPENKVTYKFDKKISRVYGRPFMAVLPSGTMRLQCFIPIVRITSLQSMVSQLQREQSI
jgi:hypothetical protein